MELIEGLKKDTIFSNHTRAQLINHQILFKNLVKEIGMATMVGVLFIEADNSLGV